MPRSWSQDEIDWPSRWQQGAIDAVLPHIGSEDRLNVLLGDPKTSISGTLMGGHLYAEDRTLMVIHDRSGRPGIYPWQMLDGPVLRIELLIPRRPRRVLLAVAGWEKEPKVGR